MLLIFPPVAKPSEPPAGIAKLAGALKAHGISCAVLDANLEGLLFLLQCPNAASDTWSRRAIRNAPGNLASLRDIQTYRSIDRYARAVRDVNRVLAVSSAGKGATIGLADYQDRHLSPLRSADLLQAAEHPEQNPFYPWFSTRLPELLGPMRDGEAEGAGTGVFIGLSLNYLSQALCAFAMIGYLRRAFPGMKIVLGGGLVTSWTKHPAWENPFGGLVDHLIAGPGEGPLLALLGVKSADRVQSVPDYSSFPLHAYLSPGFILPYSGSSGCYWNKCSFCPETAEDNPYIPVPAERVMAELTALIAATTPAMIHLLDNSVSSACMGSLVENPLGVPWYGFARISRDLADIDYCMALKRSGCMMLKLGLESGDQAVLDRMRKGIDLETVSRVLSNLRKSGIATFVYLIFGTPAETIIEARKTLEFVAAHHDQITFLNLAVFNMPVCGTEAREYETEQFYEGDLSLYRAFKHPAGWDRKAVRRFLENDFKKHRAVSAILKNDAPFFTSNHAALFGRPDNARGKE